MPKSETETTFPEEWKPMLEATQLIIGEIHECINSGGDWKNVQMALMGFALEIKEQTIKEMNELVKQARDAGFNACRNGELS